MANIITINDKINIINQHLEAIDMHILWLNNNIGVVEEIPYPGKLTMQKQLINLIKKKDMLVLVRADLESMI